jgi:hypothetical protein
MSDTIIGLDQADERQMRTRRAALIQRILLIAILACAIGLNAAWIIFLGYGLVSLIHSAN